MRKREGEGAFIFALTQGPSMDLVNTKRAVGPGKGLEPARMYFLDLL
jgi:hypothetical protein